MSEERGIGDGGAGSGVDGAGSDDGGTGSGVDGAGSGVEGAGSGGPAGTGRDPEGREADASDEERGRRPLIERLGLFIVALVMAALFAGIALALISGGELFLGVMAGLGCAMTLWVGGLTLVRG